MLNFTKSTLYRDVGLHKADMLGFASSQHNPCDQYFSLSGPVVSLWRDTGVQRCVA